MHTEINYIALELIKSMITQIKQFFSTDELLEQLKSK